MTENLFNITEISRNQFVWKDPKTAIEVWLKREDELHAFISGNKFRKLKYNLREAKKRGYSTVLTFGGAFSNHIAATAFAANAINLDCIGVIRGEELGRDVSKTFQQNSTLRFACQQGMQFHFITRESYREKEKKPFQQQLKEKFGDFYIIPEGGTNPLAIKGCKEILTQDDEKFDVLCCPVGTGGTIAGLIQAAFPHQQVYGFPALKGDFLQQEIDQLVDKKNWQLILDYHFGGYAKVTEELIQFINQFKKTYGIQLDPIYTGKMMYGIFDLLKNGHFKENTCILAIHTGGLQGVAGINKTLERKGIPQIII